MSDTTANTAAPISRLTARDKVLFSSGGGLAQFAGTAPQYLANPIFNLALGLNPVLIGGGLAAARLLDTLLEPLIGNFSNNAQSRWGRRRPFMAIGALLAGGSFIAMWWLPREASQLFYFAWFLTTIFAFFVGVSLFLVTWQALGTEMANSYDERTNLFACSGACHKIVGFATGWLYPLAQIAVFQDVLQGVRMVGLASGLLLSACCLTTALLLRKPERKATPLKRTREPFLQAMRVVLRNRVLLDFSAACLTTLTSLYAVSNLGLYINIYHIFGGDMIDYDSLNRCSSVIL